MCHSIALPFSISYSVSSGLLWQFIALYSSSSSLTLSFALAVALADSHSHSHSRSFTCLLVQLAYSPFLKWFCLIATLSFTRIFFIFSKHQYTEPDSYEQKKTYEPDELSLDDAHECKNSDIRTSKSHCLAIQFLNDHK